MPATVRDARPEDSEVIVQFNHLLAFESEGKRLDLERLTRGVRALLADPTKGRYFVAELGGDVIGQLLITYEWSDWRDGWFWWLQSVYVRADARKQGVLRGLFDHVRAEARREGNVAGFRLYVERDNRAAQEAYRRLGLAEGGYWVMESAGT
jgi:GNAT superfamily N-acetyltransferase